MKEVIKVTVLIVLFAALLIGAAFGLKNYETMQAEENENVVSDEVVETDEDAEQVEENVEDEEFESEYIHELTSDNVEDLGQIDQKIILIEYYADWCPSCDDMKTVLEEIAKENQDVYVAKLNIDESADMAYALGITAVPTFEVYKDLDKIDSHVGATTKQTILDMINKCK